MKITVITTTYNSAVTIRDTLASILRQTHQEFELIVKDGGSTDGTMQIVEEYEPMFAGRLHFITGADEGMYDAMNQGVVAATGEIVGFLNSDDFYTSEKVLATVSSVFESDETLDAVYGDVHYVNDADLKKCVRYYSSKGFKRERMMQGWMPAHPSFYCRREMYMRYGLFDTSFIIAADFELLLRMIYIHSIKTMYIEKDFVTMRMGGASTRGWHSWFLIMKDHLRAFKKNGIKNNVFRLSMRYMGKMVEIF